MKKVMVVVLLLLLSVSAVTAQDGTGTLEFRANGEDFVREGFISKDGWNISFNHIYVAISQIRAYQTTPPYDAFAGELINSDLMVGLAGQFIVDLAEGDADADTLVVGTFDSAPIGYYNAVSWVMSRAKEGNIEGSSLVMDGVAEKDGNSISFIIRVDRDYSYTCGAFVGDERKGTLAADGTGEVEMTFHFDHIFGDADLGMEEDLNVTAPGFDAFAPLAVDGTIDASLSDLEMAMSAEDYQMFVDILPSLGHTGEGHCHES